MNYIIRHLPGEPGFDTLGVLKLRSSTDAPINERIYAQAQLGRNDDCLFVKITSFETNPSANARLTAMFRSGEKELRLSMTAGGAADAVCGKSDVTAQFTSYVTRGEDLQGEYWAGVMLLPVKTLIGALGLEKTALPLELWGNILRENPAVSSAAPVDELLCFILE